MSSSCGKVCRTVFWKESLVGYQYIFVFETVVKKMDQTDIAVLETLCFHWFILNASNTKICQLLLTRFIVCVCNISDKIDKPLLNHGNSYWGSFFQQCKYGWQHCVTIPWERAHGVEVRKRRIVIGNVDRKSPSTTIDLCLRIDGLPPLTAISSCC